jgi:hypothetical protein
MIRRLLLVSALLLPSTVRAQPPAPAPAAPAKAPTFEEHVRAGDSARAAGRLKDAISAYVAALQLKDDPSVAGKLGLILFRLKDTRRAANMLVRAIEDQTVLSPRERTQVLAAWEAVRSKVCRLTIDPGPAGAEILIDGNVIDEAAAGPFVLFVDPGEHEVTARLKGYEDDTKRFTAPKGGVETVTLDPRPIAPPHVVAPAAPAPTPPAPSSAMARAPGTSGADIATTKKRSPFLPSEIAVSAGAGTVWGLSPSSAPALGPSASASVRWNVTPSVMLSAAGSFSALWSLPAGQQGTALHGDTYVAGIHGCGQWRWVFGCALVDIATVDYRLVRDTQALWLGTPVIPALGIGGGVELPHTSRFRARLRGEVARTFRQPTLTVDGRTVWMAPGFIGGVTLEGVVAFGL